MAIRAATPIAAALLAGAAGCAVLARLSDEYAGPGPSDAAPEVEVEATPSADAPSPPDAAEDAREAGTPGVDARVPDAADGGCPYLFCDDFEGTLSAWSVIGADAGTVVNDSTFACNGAKALHVKAHVSGGAGESYAFEVRRKDAFPKDLYVRVFARFAVRPNPDITFLDIFDPAGEGVQEEVDTGNFDGENYNFDSHKTWNSIAARIGQCDCVELAVLHSKNQVVVSINGNSTTSTGFNSMPTFDTIALGVEVQLLQSISFDEEAWFDDIAYDGKPIGCAK